MGLFPFANPLMPSNEIKISIFFYSDSFRKPMAAFWSCSIFFSFFRFHYFFLFSQEFSLQTGSWSLFEWVETKILSKRWVATEINAIYWIRRILDGFSLKIASKTYRMIFFSWEIIYLATLSQYQPQSPKTNALN